MQLLFVRCHSINPSPYSADKRARSLLTIHPINHNQLDPLLCTTVRRFPHQSPIAMRPSLILLLLSSVLCPFTAIATSLPSTESVSNNPQPQASDTSGTGWVKQIEYSGTTFFDGWDFFSETGERSLTPPYVLHVSMLNIMFRSQQWP